MATFKFDHIHLKSPDPAETAAYYERMFGATLIHSMKGGKPRIDMDLCGQMVFIAPVAADDGTAQAPQSPYMGLEHLGLIVEDIDSVVAELKAKGAEFTIRPGTRIAFLRGPQDVSIELVDRNA